MTRPELTADQVPSEWIAIVREIVQREGRAIRGPADRPVIEVKCLVTNQWGILMLYSSVKLFATIADRDEVLAKIMRKSSQ